jgi:hypothetical protein
MPDSSPSIPQVGDLSAVSVRRLPFDDGLSVTQPLDLSEIIREATRHTVASAPGVAA